MAPCPLFLGGGALPRAAAGTLVGVGVGLGRGLDLRVGGAGKGL